MSALTKVFVVLLVIVCLLLVPAIVVFVNKNEDANTLAKHYKADAELARREQKAMEVKDLQVIAEKTQAANEANERANKLVTTNQALDAKVTDLNAQIAKAQADNATVATQVTTLTNALKQAQDTMAATEVVVKGLRDRNDDLEKKNTESQVALSDVNQQVEALKRELNYKKEQVAALETEIGHLRQQLVELPVRSAAPGAPAGPGAVAPSAAPSVPSNVTIRGVVKNKFQVGEVSYATVSVGSADSVSKGAKFNVTDPSGRNFLGYLIIDSVNPNEASGHLNGPNVEAVQKGSTVVSNWQ